MLPLSTSAVTLGFGFIIALDEPPLNLRTSWWLVPLAHCPGGLSLCRAQPVAGHARHPRQPAGGG